MISLETIDKYINKGSRVIAVIGLVGMLLLSLMIVLEVFSRTVLKFAVLGIFDFTSLGMGVFIASCLPLVFANRRNISVRVLGKITNPRINALLDAFGNLAALFIYVIMIIQLIRYVRDLAVIQETTIIAKIPMAPFIGFMTFLLLLCMPVQIFCLIKDLSSAVKRNRQCID